MTKTDKKIISIFLLLIIFIAQLSPVFATDNTTEETKTLTQYLIENGVDSDGDGVLSDAEWAKVKNLNLENIDITGIEKAVNLKKLVLNSCDVGNVDFSKLTKLEELSLEYITLSDNAQASIGKAANLEMLSLYSCVNYTKINYSGLQKLTDLTIAGCEDDNNSYKFPSIPSLKFLKYWTLDEVYIDFSELSNIEDVEITLRDGTAKFPKFSDLKYIEVQYAGEYGKLINVDGYIDLSSCENVYGYLEVDSAKLALNGKTLCSKGSEGVELDTIDYEINVIKGKSYGLTSGTEIYELIQNDDDNVASFEVQTYYYDENYKRCYISGKNEGTTNMKIKDALGNEVIIKINVSNITIADTSLEYADVTAEFVGYCEKILKSNGELWEINSETTAEIVETNVKDYVAKGVYAYGSGNGAYVVENLLKNNGKLRIEYVDTVKEVSNVKQVEDNVYLTNDGKLYELGLNYITEEINPKLIKENVKKLINECIVLEDGTTWYQNYELSHTTYNVEFKKLADFEIKDMDYYKNVISENSYREIPTVVDLDNNLWCCSSKNYYFDDSGLEKIQENFEGYGRFYSIDGIKILENGDALTRYFDREQGGYVNGQVILSYVSQAYYNNAGDGYVLIRTDGTIWTYSEQYGLTKITKSTSINDSDDEEENKTENYLNTTSSLKIKKFKNYDVLTGISDGTTVQDFINQNNFNGEYQVKIFDNNNNEIKEQSTSLATGNVVKLYKNGELVKEYTVVIYGDTTGDGQITAVDALAVVKHINSKILFTKEAYIEAGKVKTASGGSLTAVDALAIVKSTNGQFTINQNK